MHHLLDCLNMSKMLLVLALVAIPTIQVILANTRVEISLQATNLTNQDVCCTIPNLAPDAYCIVFSAPSAFENWTEIGRTQVIDNEYNPVWPQKFNFNVSENDPYARLRVEVWDEDVGNPDDYIGFVEFRLFDLIISVDSNYTLYEKILGTDESGLVIQGRINATNRENLQDNVDAPKIESILMPFLWKQIPEN